MLLQTYYLYCLMALVPLVCLVLHRKHLLMSLLMLEAFILAVILLIPTSIFNERVRIPLVVVFLTIAACEARLGLSLLVITARSYGNDLLQATIKRLC